MLTQIETVIFPADYQAERDFRVARDQIVAGEVLVVRHVLGVGASLLAFTAHIPPCINQFPAEIEAIDEQNGILNVAARKLDSEGVRSRHVRTYTVNEASVICKRRDTDVERGCFMPLDFPGLEK